MDSAFYLHGLTDVVPELVHVATPHNSTRIRDSGVQAMESGGYAVRAFSWERMLVELLRNAGTLPMDYYRELIGSYRRIASELDMREAEDCLALYRRSGSLFDMMQREML